MAKKKSTRKSSSRSGWSVRKRGSGTGRGKAKSRGSTRKSRGKKSGGRRSGGSGRRRGAAGKVPGRVLVMLAVLALLGVGGIASVRYLRSPAGHASLLDKGFTHYYPRVHKAIDTELRAALAAEGLDGRLSEITVRDTAGQRSGPSEWYVRLPEKAILVDINLALTDAAKRGGGRVRESIEHDGGRTLFMEFGSRGHATHRVTLSKNGRGKTAYGPGGKGGADTGGRGGEGTTDRGGNGGGPRVAIVIDDLGYARNGVARQMIEMKLPLSISILPGLPHTQNVLAMAREAHRCTLLHLPMQAEESEQKPDTEPVSTDMSDGEIRRLVDDYLDAMKGVDGVNNHQGSLATADARVMRATLGPVRDRGLFFLDSLTSPKSVAYNTAREIGVPTARNSLFLDADTEDPDVVESRLRQLLETAVRHGSAVGIGHPHEWTLEALEHAGALLREYGVTMVPVCELVR